VLAKFLVLLLLLVAAEAAAQTPPKAPRWDVAASTGFFVGHPGDPPGSESFDEWYNAATLGITAGRYLTSNLKLEGELTLSGEGSRYGVRLAPLPGIGPYPVSVELLTRTNSGSAALVWQFFENQWVHPFLMAGATFDFDHESVHMWQQSYFGTNPRVSGNEILVASERTENLGTTRRVRGLLGGGAKLYVSPSAFFRADARIGVGADAGGHVAFRLGFGVDF
jgi:hypothetical protein